MTTFVDNEEGDLAQVCERCLTASPEAGSDYCAACALGGGEEEPASALWCRECHNFHAKDAPHADEAFAP